MNWSFTTWRRHYLAMDWDRKVLVLAGMLALLPLVAAALWRTPAAEATKPAASVDTYIPKGFVLVPIEVQNYEALDSILGRFAVVDLFQAGPTEGAPQRLVARNVRLLRAPQNPAHFAILVQEAQVSEVLRGGAQFTVILKRAGEIGTEFVKTPRVSHREIVYDGGSR